MQNFVIPLSLPALAVLAIFSVMWRWNDFLWPYLIFGVAGRTEWQPIMVRLYYLQGAVDNSTLLAALVLGLSGVAIAEDDTATDEKTPPVDTAPPDDGDSDAGDGEEETE